MKTFGPVRLTLAAAIAAAAIPAAAQNALEEVIVTAEKRSVNVQDVPISMTVFGADGLDDKAVTRIDELQYASPSLSITTSGLVQAVNIRGIGIASGSPNVTNGVSTYVDGLFQPPIVQTSSFYDIADVQVLRGPQGTFAGSNSTGGAVIINSRNPDPDAGVEGYLELGAGDYSKYEAQGAVNIPLGDTFAVRAAGNYRKRDSFYDDKGTAGSDAGELDETAFRLGALWRPTDSFQALFKYENLEKDTGGYAARPVEGSAFSAGRTNDIYDLSYNTPTQNEDESDSYMLELQYEFAGGIMIKGIAGYQEKRVFNEVDTDYTTLALNTTDQWVAEDQTSYEVTILSPDDQRLRWVVGGYYQLNEIDVELNNNKLTFPVDVYIQNEKEINGIFGQVQYDITDALEWEFGLRKAWFDGEGTGGVFIGAGIPVFPPGGLQVANLGGEHEDDDVMGKMALNWRMDENNLLYAFVARGYKPGGADDGPEFDQETVWDYEAGWKATMADGAVRTNLNFFYMDYQDFQYELLNPTTGRSVVDNIGDSEIKGFEFELTAQLGDLRVDGGVSYVDSELDPGIPIIDSGALPGNDLGPQCPDGVESNPPECFDYTPFYASAQSGPNLYSPEWSYNIGVEYAIEAGGMSITPRLNYSWQDEQYAFILYSETDLLEDRGLWSALVTFELDDWRAQVYGWNLTDEEYVAGHSGNNQNEYYSSPRQYGVRVNYTF